MPLLALAYARVEVFAVGAWAALRLRKRGQTSRGRTARRDHHGARGPSLVTAAMMVSFARESPRPTLFSLGVVALEMIVYRAPRERADDETG
jgi:hypothetical protein